MATTATPSTQEEGVTFEQVDLTHLGTEVVRSGKELAQIELARLTAIADQTSAAAMGYWGSIDSGLISGSYAADSVASIITTGQQAAASGAQGYVTQLVKAWVTPDPVGTVLSKAFAGVASDGRSLATLVYLPVIEAKQRIASGQTVREALEMGGRSLDGIVRTQVFDAGRAAEHTAAVLDDEVIGYVRELRGDSCDRCLILAGRVYRWSHGFLRHPRCDCVMRPITRNEYLQAPTSIINDPRKAFEAMSKEHQDKVFGEANAETIRMGGDIGRVVNAKRGMYVAETGAKYTWELRAYQGKRLMPETIFRIAKGDRREARRLLVKYGYASPTPPPKLPTRVAPPKVTVSYKRSTQLKLPFPEPTPEEVAHELVQKAWEREKAYSDAMQHLAKEHDTKLAGFEKYRVKTEDSLARKIRLDIEEAKKEGTVLTPSQAGALIHDVNRYTMLIQPARYSEVTDDSIQELRRLGYQLRVKNKWLDHGDPYQGINVQVTDPVTHATFELQFHTPASFDMKEKILHPAYYEKMRLLAQQGLGDSPEYLRMRAAEFRWERTVEVPKGLYRIEMPQWARDAQLDELLDDLPYDRTTIGIIPAPIPTVRGVQLDIAAGNLSTRGGKYQAHTWEELQKEAEYLRPKVAAVDAQLTKLRAEFDQVSARIDDPDWWNTATYADRDASLHRLNEIRGEIDKLDSYKFRQQRKVLLAVDNPDLVIRSETPFRWETITPEEAAKRLGRYPKEQLAVDTRTGKPLPVLRQQADTLHRIGEKVDLEVRARWAAKYPNTDYPLDYRDLEDEVKRLTLERDKVVHAASKAATKRGQLVPATGALTNQALADLMQSPEYRRAAAALNEARDRLIAHHPPTDQELEQLAQLTKDTVAEVRKMADTTTMQKIVRPATRAECLQVPPVYGTPRVPDEALMEAFYQGGTHFPADWVRRVKEQQQGASFAIIHNDRGYFDNGDKIIAVSDEGAKARETAVHELSHLMETGNPEIPRLEYVYLWDRSNVRGNFPKLQHLFGYGTNEWGLPGDFTHPYSGKVYVTLQEVMQGSRSGTDAMRIILRNLNGPDVERQAFEVLSTGTETTYPRVHGRGDKVYDRKMREMILGWLVGL